MFAQGHLRNNQQCRNISQYKYNIKLIRFDYSFRFCSEMFTAVQNAGMGVEVCYSTQAGSNKM